MIFKSRNLMQIKTKDKCKFYMCFLDQNVMFFPMVYLAFTVSLILCTGKWIEKFPETALAFYSNFQHKALSLQGIQVHHSKDCKVLV